MFLGGDIKVKTIYYYNGEGADDINLYFKIDDIVIQNPAIADSPEQGIVIYDSNVFNKCLNYIKERYTFDFNGGIFTIMNIEVAYNNNAIIFTIIAEYEFFNITIIPN